MIKNVLQNRRGIAIELALVIMLVGFSLCALIVTYNFSLRKTLYLSDANFVKEVKIDQLGHDFATMILSASYKNGEANMDADSFGINWNTSWVNSETGEMVVPITYLYSYETAGDNYHYGKGITDNTKYQEYTANAAHNKAETDAKSASDVLINFLAKEEITGEAGTKDYHVIKDLTISVSDNTKTHAERLSVTIHYDNQAEGTEDDPKFKITRWAVFSETDE